MLCSKTTISALSREAGKCYNLWRVLSVQQARPQTNAATVELNAEANSEWEHARPLQEMPTMSRFQLIRSFLPGGQYYNMDSSQLMLALRKNYGDIFLWPSMFGKPRMVITHNPDDFKRVFRTEGVWPERRGIDTLDYYRHILRADFFQGIEGLIATQGEYWGTFRSAVNTVLMQPKNITLYLDKMSNVNAEFVKRIKEIRNPKTLEVPATFEEETNRWTLESVSIVALDRQLGLLKQNRNDPDAKRLFTSLTEFFRLNYELGFKPSMWKYVQTPDFKRLIRVFDDIQQLTLKYVSTSLERLEEERKRGVERPENEKSVLEKLLKIDERIATVMAMDMLMAGVDTTSGTFLGTLLCLAKNPAKQEKLREEVLRLLPNKDSEFTRRSLNNIPYLRACIKEALRLYPLMFANGRSSQKNVVLSGYKVPKGELITMVTIGAMQEEKYFPRAKEYLPERWLRASKESAGAAECPNAVKASTPFAYLPFGFGPRSCIGKRIAAMELELGVARIIRNFKVEFNYPTENAFKSLLISMPNIPMTFKFTDVE